MSKFCGKVGFIKSVETEPGIWENEVTERQYYGDVTRSSSTFQTSGNVNDNISIANSISMVADPFAHENFQYMRYIIFSGTKWKISNIEIQYPRLLLTVGGVYNGK